MKTLKLRINSVLSLISDRSFKRFINLWSFSQNFSQNKKNIKSLSNLAQNHSSGESIKLMKHISHSKIDLTFDQLMAQFHDIKSSNSHRSVEAIHDIDRLISSFVFENRLNGLLPIIIRYVAKRRLSKKRTICLFECLDSLSTEYSEVRDFIVCLTEKLDELELGDSFDPESMKKCLAAVSRLNVHHAEVRDLLAALTQRLPEHYFGKNSIMPIVQVPANTKFLDFLSHPLPVRIPVASIQVAIEFPDTFYFWVGENNGLSFEAASYVCRAGVTNVDALSVVCQDNFWLTFLQSVVKNDATVNYHDENTPIDAPPTFDISFSYTRQNVTNVTALVYRATVFAHDLVDCDEEMAEMMKLDKFLVSSDTNGLFGFTSSLTLSRLYWISVDPHSREDVSQTLLKEYDVSSKSGRVELISDVYRIGLWILSH